jgi:hypothetical protein
LILLLLLMILIIAGVFIRIGLDHTYEQVANWTNDGSAMSILCPADSLKIECFGPWGSDPSQVSNLSWSEQFIRAIYFTVVTLTTVGYGDFLPQTNNEYLFTMAVEFVGIAFFSIVMGSISEVFVSSDDTKDKIEQKIEEADRWMVALDDANDGKTLQDSLYKKI